MGLINRENFSRFVKRVGEVGTIIVERVIWENKWASRTRGSDEFGWTWGRSGYRYGERYRRGKNNNEQE